MRIFLAGLWICLVSWCGMFFSARQDTHPVGDGASEQGAFGGVEYIKSDIMNVPIIEAGKVTGYILARLVYTIDSNLRFELTDPLNYIINDQIFRTFYGNYSEARQVEKVKFDDVRQSIIDGVNAHFPNPVVKELLVEQFNYISSDKIRARNVRRAENSEHKNKG